MRPKKLVLSAWGPYKGKVEIDFTVYEKQGIFLITGATGAGKTTLFDSIAYALYGSLSGEVRDKERSSVRSDFAEGDVPTYVELTMEHAGQMYFIRRNPEYLRPKKRSKDGKDYTKEKENAVLYLPDGGILEGTKEVNAKLQELLVLDYHQFKQISMIAQGEFARLLTASPKDKTKIFREIFGTGVYERFTFMLGVRSKGLYAQIMEQKNKLEEDIRLLTVGLENAGWSLQVQERLLRATQSANWNYDEIQEVLVQMDSESAAQLSQAKKEYEAADSQSEKLTKKLTGQQAENQRIEQYQKAAAERECLKAKKKEFAEKEQECRQAENAEWVERAEEQLIQLTKSLQKNQEKREILQKELEDLEKERRELQPAFEGREELEHLLRLSERRKKQKEEWEFLKKQEEDKKEALALGQEQFLAADRKYREKLFAVQEAEHGRQLSAIGIAVGMLQEGSPCPVCGSLHHPAPAKAEGAVVSEEEWKNRKEEAAKAEEEAGAVHEQVVTLKTRLESLQEQEEQAFLRLQETEQSLMGNLPAVAMDFLQMEPEQARKKLQDICARMQQTEGLLQEKGKSLHALKEEKATGEQEREAAERALEETAKQYGFADVNGYRKAKRTREERMLLQEAASRYQKQCAANQELYEHLKSGLKNKKMVDLSGLEEQLQECKNRKAQTLNGQKLWERHHSEVQKITRQMKEKRSVIDMQSREYGYVKDLENLASGNNPRKLVFEQYVLAGYFEEILRAANLRFLQMTSGRYEMSRVEQVGDGRVKDNLEIQVLDYYTGKYRSVRTLSGGESFKASLSLALGMSDVIQAMNGGIRVDTLFIDEGFGALDSESLDQACDTLMGLVERDRMIGIISHVPELKERIGRQLVIDKTGSGSSVRMMIS